MSELNGDIIIAHSFRVINDIYLIQNLSRKQYLEPHICHGILQSICCIRCFQVHFKWEKEVERDRLQFFISIFSAENRKPFT